jgi:hypothetical protein
LVVTGAEQQTMVITLDPKLEAALQELASREGVAPEQLASELLRERLLAATTLEPRDEWERGLLDAARPWGVSLSDATLSSEELYD